MKKIFKILFNVLSTLVILIIVLPLVVAMLLQVNSIQNFVLHKLTKIVSEKLETKVSIGYINIDNLYTINIYDIYVEDPLEQDTLLNVSQLSCGAFSLGIVSGPITFDHILVKDGVFHMNEYEDGGNNLKYIIKKLQNPQKKSSKVNLLFKRIDIENISFAYSKFHKRGSGYGVNFRDIYLNDISGKVDDMFIEGDEITFSVDGLNFLEKGDVKVKSLSVDHVYLSSDSMVYSNGLIKIENSYIDFTKFKMSYKNWNMSNFVKKVNLSIDITKSAIDFKDVAKFTKKEQEWKSVVTFSGNFNGTISDFSGVIRKISTNSTTIENSHYRIKNVPDVPNMIFDINIGDMVTNFDDIYFGANDFSKKNIPTVADLAVSKKMIIKGFFRGKTSDFKAFCEMKPLVGDGYGKIDLSMSMIKDKISINGDLKTSKLDLSTIIKNDVIKKTTASLKLSGYIKNSDFVFKSNGFIDNINLFDRNFNSIKIDGDFQNKTFLGSIFSEDKNLNFDFNGLLDMTASQPSYNFNLDLRKADLIALKLLERDSISSLKARLLVNGLGVSLDNISLQSTIDNLVFVSNTDTIDLKDKINIIVKNNEKSKLLELRSVFADVTLKGVLSYKTIIDYIKKSIGAYLPVFQKGDVSPYWNNLPPKDSSSLLNEDYFYVAKLDVKETTQLAQVFVPGLVLAEGTKVMFTFNPLLNTHSLNVNSSFISYKEDMISNLSINSGNVADSLSIFVSAKEILYKNIYIPNLSIINRVSNDKLSLTMGYSNEKNKSKLLINSEGVINRDSINNKIYLTASVLPSFYRFGTNQWDILGGDFVFGADRTLINNFEINAKDEVFRANGAVSKLPTDTLSLKLVNFDISPISLLLKNIGFYFDGNAGGDVDITAATSKENMEIFGYLNTHNLRVNGAAVEDSKIDIFWDDYRSQADFKMTTLEHNQEIVDGYYNPNKKRYFFQFKFDDISPRVISPFLNGISSDIYGGIKVDLTISNNNVFNQIMLNGSAQVKSFSTKIDYTNVVYKTSGLMTIKDNIFSMKDILVKDTLGGSGDLNLRMALDKTRGFEFDINIKPKKMLALNSNQRMNPVFYGSVFATGDVRIRSVVGGVSLVANVATAKDSKFFLPLSHNAYITEADFIKFVPREAKTSGSMLWDMRNKNDKSKLSGGTFDIRLNAKVLNNTDIEIVIDPLSGSTINASGYGDFDIHVNPKEDVFSINGNYNISKGNYRFILPNINLLDKNFTIKDGGWIHFNGDPMDATLDVNAVYKVKASLVPLIGDETEGNSNRRINVDCLMNIKGNLLKPDVVLGVDVLNTDPETNSIVRSALNTQEEISNQFVFLLLSNSFTSSQTGSSSGDFGKMAGIVTGIEYLTNKIKNIISSDKFDFNFSYTPKDKYTSDEFGVGFSTPLLGDKLFLDVQGNFNLKNNDAANAKGNVSVLSGDFYLTWILNESGNLRMKAFSRTIDTFDENQGLQENGVGIYYSEEFDTLKELINNYKRYFAERRKRRDARKIEKQQKKEAKAKANSSKIVEQLEAK